MSRPRKKESRSSTPAGSSEFGYHSEFAGQPPQIADCYAVTIDDQSRLVVFPYTDFPIVRIDLGTRTRDVFSTPESVHGAHAICAVQDRIYFAGPYGQRTALHEWRLGDTTAPRCGTLDGVVRGLNDGRLLVRDASGYTVVSVG